MASKYGLIYGLRCTCHPEYGIRYVGQTSQSPATRLSEHRRKSRYNPRFPVQQWIVLHGESQIVMDVLEDGLPLDLLDNHEEYWIAKLETLIDLDLGGLNLTCGGAGMAGLAQASRDRLREANSAERGSNTLLTWLQVNEIRRAYLDGELNQPELALKYNVSRGTINDIIRHRTWQDPEYQDSAPRRKRVTPHVVKLSKDDVNEMRRMAIQGMTNADIAKKFDLNVNYTVSILRNHRKPDPNYTPLTREQACAVRPSRRPSAKLTYEIAQEIRSKHATGEWSYSRLADEYDITLSNVGYVVRGKTWTKP